MATFCLEMRPSKAFDYAYFLNHRGWMEGLPDTFTMYGNTRANGHLSFYNSSAYVNGHPEYKSSRGEKQYKDTGGIYSAFGLLDASSLNGMGALAANQYVGEDLNDNHVLDSGEDHNQDGELTRPEQVAMPNLAELGPYEEYARSWNGGTGSSIRIEAAGTGGTDLVVSNSVYGDEDGEKGNLMLWGTQQNPIVVDGPVVVRGAVIIKGYVKGKGCIYTRHNIYIPDNLMYVNPPVGAPNWNYYAYSTPQERYEAWMQAASQWRQENADKDGLGLLAGENVVIGDFQAASWSTSVDSWLNTQANESAESANGLDHIPNTNDQGENDGVWTVDRYSQGDLEKGLIPPGKSSGEVVPGSGEDVDGDGFEDGRISLADFDLPYPLDTAYWGGWVPLTQSGDSDAPGSGKGRGGGSGAGKGRGGGSGADKGRGGGRGGDKGRGGGGGQDNGGGGGWPTSYSDLINPNGGDALDHIDAMLFTNHATAANLGMNSPQVHLLGGIVSRIAAIIFKNDGSAQWIHDERFTGGGEEFGFVLPRVKQPIQIVYWGEVPGDNTQSGQ